MILSPQRVIFYCEASGVLTPNITWRMNGETLESESEDTILIDSTGGKIRNSTLQILNTLPIDTGTYTCVATNAAGSDTASAEFIVNCTLINIHVSCPFSHLPQISAPIHVITGIISSHTLYTHDRLSNLSTLFVGCF